MGKLGVTSSSLGTTIQRPVGGLDYGKIIYFNSLLIYNIRQKIICYARDRYTWCRLYIVYRYIGLRILFFLASFFVEIHSLSKRQKRTDFDWHNCLSNLMLREMIVNRGCCLLMLLMSQKIFFKTPNHLKKCFL